VQNHGKFALPNHFFTKKGIKKPKNCRKRKKIAKISKKRFALLIKIVIFYIEITNKNARRT
jgi:hypothetical protein